MAGSRPSRLAWSLWGLAIGSAVLGLVFAVLVLPANLPEGREPFLAAVVVQGLMVVLYGTLGATISSRHPRNAIGWIFCFMALSLGVLSFAYGYADYALYARDGAGGVFLAAAVFAAWISNWIFVLAVFVAVCFLFLLFPDGRPASPRWRPVVLALTVLAALSTLTAALDPVIFSFPTVENPVAPEGRPGEIAAVANDLTELSAIPAFLVSVASMVSRLRRSRGIERQQLKWVAYAALLTATSFAASFLAGPLTDGRAAEDVFFLLGVAGFAGIPVAAGVAILRHRLFDIDLLINKTLVYATLTITLAAVYLAGVASSQYLLHSLTGNDSQITIVASTLAIAALFSPLRKRIQIFVDRRFYREKYDAKETLAAFSARLRDETDLDALSDGLLGVVRETVQPARVSLWMRDPDSVGKPKSDG
jgi:hypothetical protein